MLKKLGVCAAEVATLVHRRIEQECFLELIGHQVSPRGSPARANIFSVFDQSADSALDHIFKFQPATLINAIDLVLG
jgi:hypothetical protein